MTSKRDRVTAAQKEAIVEYMKERLLEVARFGGHVTQIVERRDIFERYEKLTPPQKHGFWSGFPKESLLTPKQAQRHYNSVLLKELSRPFDAESKAQVTRWITACLCKFPETSKQSVANAITRLPECGAFFKEAVRDFVYQQFEKLAGALTLQPPS